MNTREQLQDIENNLIKIAYARSKRQGFLEDTYFDWLVNTIHSTIQTNQQLSDENKYLKEQTSNEQKCRECANEMNEIRTAARAMDQQLKFNKEKLEQYEKIYWNQKPLLQQLNKEEELRNRLEVKNHELVKEIRELDAAIQRRDHTIEVQEKQINEMTNQFTDTEVPVRLKSNVTGKVLATFISPIRILELDGEALVENLTSCSCQPIGETNVIECNCDAEWDDYELYVGNKKFE